MGEVFDALQVLNRTMKLGLSAHDLMAAEMTFKHELARDSARHPDKHVPADPVALSEDYELFVTLKRRPTKVSLSDLSRYAGQAVSQPAPSDEAKSFSESDQAIKKHSSP